MKRKPLYSILILAINLHLHSFAAVYYVDDVSGNDINNGLTTVSAWQSLAHVSSYALLPGDTVKFKRGGIWRGQLLPKNGNSSNYIVYTAYGTGAKPLFLGSVNASTTGDWIDEGGNIWRSVTTCTVDIGNLIFNGASSFGNKKWNASDLAGQGDFWWDKLGSHAVKIYSLGNPATVYNEIEVANGNHIIFEQLNNYITFENLALKYGSGNGFEVRNTHHTVIKDCDISYIGGSETGVQVRYGNAIQFWASSNNNIVKRCRIWEIYDTGVTNQNNNSGGACQQYNLYYTNNIIWNCAYAGFEVWVDAFGTSSLMKNIYFDNNTCVNIGGGWANAKRPDHFLQTGAGSSIYFGHNSAITDSIFVRNNIFYKAHCIFFANNEGIQTLLETDMDHNNWYRENPTDTIAVFYTTSTVDLWTNSQFANYQATNNRDINSITVDPLFTNELTKDFTLTSSSPCIDAGTNTGISYDFQFTSVPQNINYDIGAYEYIAGMEVEELQNNAPHFQLYPNPTNGICQLNSGTREWTEALLTITDINGRSIDSQLISGSNILLDLSSEPSGIYFVQLYQDGERMYSGKIILQK